jgi:hypothetical protein
MNGESRTPTPHAALHELLGRIIRVRAGMEPNFQSITERADKMSALAGEAILELVELERASETSGLVRLREWAEDWSKETAVMTEAEKGWMHAAREVKNLLEAK